MMKDRTTQMALVERVRDLLTDESVQREVSMFGGRSFMINEKLAVCAMKDGSLLVRVDPAQHDQLLQREGASQAEMGVGRDMGPGWLVASAAILERDSELAFWVETSLRHNRVLTGTSV